MTIHYTRSAIADLDEAWAFVMLDDPATAAATGQRLRHAIETVGAHPYRGTPGRVEDTWEFAVPQTPFIIVYRQAGWRVDIVSVLHRHRVWPRRLG